MSDKHQKPGSPFLILFLAVAIVVAVSIIPIAALTDGKLSDFSLFADLFGFRDSNPNKGDSSMPADPMLLALIEEDKNNPLESSQNSVTENDTIVEKPKVVPPPKVAKRDLGGIVDIEDYTDGNTGLANLKNAIAQGHFSRIAFIGDSYIEADIFVQNVRSKLQGRFGGSGVGYVNMYSEFPGFRQSVTQSGSGWIAHIAGKSGTQSKYLGLAESYFNSDGNALARYKGAKKIPNTDSWNVSKFLCVAPEGGSVSLSSDSESKTFALDSSSRVQCLDINGFTTDFSVSLNNSSIVALGVWLDSSSGIGVDCMSSRGFSGVSLSSVSLELCRQMSDFVDYDLIILQFGLNAMSAGQNNYSVYSKHMAKAVEHLRNCYPNAEFMIMGVGDRGEKQNGEIHSMSTVQNMIDAQRDAARNARCLFWDTREAMGGYDAIVEWTDQGYTNKDYIHMSHKGGAKLADSFVESLMRLLQ